MILDLVSRWINFCETEHQSYCSLSIWVAMVTFEKTFYTNLNATPFYCRIQLFSSFKLFFLWTNIFQTFWKRKVHLPRYSDIKCIQWKDICIISILSTVNSWPLSHLFCHFLLEPFKNSTIRQSILAYLFSGPGQLNKSVPVSNSQSLPSNNKSDPLVPFS